MSCIDFPGFSSSMPCTLLTNSGVMSDHLLINSSVLVGESFEGFSLETARSMVALMDVDTSGTLGFEEFKTLWFELRLWLTIFKEADSANAGRLRTYDLRTVLSDTGISISNDIFKAIVCRYAHNGVIVFDDFILLLVRLITVFSKFKENLDRRGGNRATFNVDVDIMTRSGYLITDACQRSLCRSCKSVVVLTQYPSNSTFVFSSHINPTPTCLGANQ
ncbi:hypothetical protein ACTXT7_012590 [Hymenolepis weldensis]